MNDRNTPINAATGFIEVTSRPTILFEFIQNLWESGWRRQRLYLLVSSSIFW